MELSSACRSVSELRPRPNSTSALAVVVAMAVEGAIDPALDAALEGIEYSRRDENGKHQAPLAHRLRHGVVDPYGDEGDDAEVSAEQKSRGQCVGHAALEDQVGIHQPVAHDRPAEGERQKYQREPGQVGEQARRLKVQQVRNGVEEREGQNGQQRPARNPLQLLAQQRRIGAAVAVQEQKRRGHVEDRVVSGRDLVEPVEQYLGGFARGD